MLPTRLDQGTGWEAGWSAIGSGSAFCSGGVVPGGVSVGCHGDRPAALVYLVVVVFAEWDHVSEVGGAAVFPEVDVVDAAVVEGDGAVGVGAGAVEGAECSSLGAGGGAVLASDVEEFALAVEYDWDDVGVAAESADGGHG